MGKGGTVANPCVPGAYYCNALAAPSLPLKISLGCVRRRTDRAGDRTAPRTPPRPPARCSRARHGGYPFLLTHHHPTNASGAAPATPRARSSRRPRPAPRAGTLASDRRRSGISTPASLSTRIALTRFNARIWKGILERSSSRPRSSLADGARSQRKPCRARIRNPAGR